MKVFSAQGNIRASAETIWQIITDAPSYPSWEPSVERFEGTIGPEQRFVAYSKLTPGRGFPIKVTVFEPPKRMVWLGGMPLGLFKGERTFTLTPRGEGTVDFTMREEFSGLLLPLIGRSLPDMTAVFEGFVAGLKARAEAG